MISIGSSRRNALNLIALLVFFPALVSYLHVGRTLQQSELCFVAPPASRNNVFLEFKRFSSSSDLSIATDTSSAAGDNNKYDDVFRDLYGVYSKSRNGIFSLIRKQGGNTTPLDSRSSSGWRKILKDKISFLIGGGAPWPSVTTFSSSLSDVIFSSRSGGGAHWQQQGGYIAYNEAGGKWCIYGSRQKEEPLICSTTDAGTKGQFPASGVWTNSDDSQPLAQVQVQCPNTPPNKPKNERKKKKINKNLQQLLNNPSTSLLLILNTYLAFRYWNDRTSVSSVSKIYNRIVPSSGPPYEIWRGFTGAFAHFEMLHLGFNMMSLYALGGALEGSAIYGSIPFFFLNLALVVLTTATMMIVSYVKIHKYQQVGVGDQQTVGYSGVIFAWVVITSVEQSQTCPIFFLPDVCFQTYTMGMLKFNAAPLVQLVVTHFIMPRASFVGHLAGIVCGFLLHWRILPHGFLMPHVLFPVFAIWHLACVQKILPVKRSIVEYEYCVERLAQKEEERRRASSLNNANEHTDLPPSPSRRQPPNQTTPIQRAMYIIPYIQKLHLCSILMSILISLDAGLTLSQIGCAILFHQGIEAYKCVSLLPSTDRKQSTSITGRCLRAYFIIAVIDIVMDAMSIGCWLLPTHVPILSMYNSPVSLASIIHGSILSGMVVLTILLRCIVNTAGLVLASKVLNHVESGSAHYGSNYNKTGIFHIMFGFVFTNAALIADDVLTKTGNDWNAFEGHGVILGRVTAIV